MKLRDCFLTAAFVPRPASALRSVFDAPLDLSMTFYGPDPLVGVWGMSCDRARVGGRRAGSLVLSLVGVPVGLTSPEALPLANNFAHRLFRMDTSSARLAAVARRVGLAREPVALGALHPLALRADPVHRAARGAAALLGARQRR